MSSLSTPSHISDYSTGPILRPPRLPTLYSKESQRSTNEYEQENVSTYIDLFIFSISCYLLFSDLFF